MKLKLTESQALDKAREIIAMRARGEGNHQLADELISGCWDTRSDIKTVMDRLLRGEDI